MFSIVDVISFQNIEFRGFTKMDSRITVLLSACNLTDSIIKTEKTLNGVGCV